MEELTFEQLPKAVAEIRTKEHTPKEEYVDIHGASEILSVAVQTIYGYVCQRRIPVYKRGKRLYFSRQELNDYLKAGRIRTMEEIEIDADKLLLKNRRKY